MNGKGTAFYGQRFMGIVIGAVLMLGGVVGWYEFTGWEQAVRVVVGLLGAAVTGISIYSIITQAPKE